MFTAFCRIALHGQPKISDFLSGQPKSKYKKRIVHREDDFKRDELQPPCFQSTEMECDEHGYENAVTLVDEEALEREEVDKEEEEDGDEQEDDIEEEDEVEKEVDDTEVENSDT